MTTVNSSSVAPVFLTLTSQPVTVSLVQAGLDRGWWSRDYRVVSETVPGEQVNADRRKWEVPVPANGATDMTVVVESRY